jgi:hypothetical protein
VGRLAVVPMPQTGRPDGRDGSNGSCPLKGNDLSGAELSRSTAPPPVARKGEL